MKAVWSFWTKPFFASRKSSWISERQHWLSWVLSFETARRHFSETSLYTDDAGAQILVEGLGLEFDTVSTELNALENHDSKWWALGKIYTYQEQKEPFIHIDNDVFLWKALPVRPDTVLFAQNPEPFAPGASYYVPEELEATLARQKGTWLPKEWRWFRSSGLLQRGECCGVFGGADTDFIRYYARLAIQIVESPSNRDALSGLNSRVERNILIEQYLLSACIEYHRAENDSAFSGLHIEYLFNSKADALQPHKAAEAGYTHMIASAKKNARASGHLEQRVQQGYPDKFERCERMASRVSSANALFRR
jgi:hypothetical protein